MYGEDAMTDWTCQKWFEKFHSGDFSLDDAPWSGRPVEVESDQIETIIENNQCYTMQEIADILKISKSSIENHLRASLVAQWLGVCLPMQGTRVRALVWEDPTCRGATGPVSHNCWACASGVCARNGEATVVRGPRTAMKSGPHLPQLERALAQKWRPITAINK